LVPAEDASMLRVEDVDAGPIASWNQQQTKDAKNTVRKGDFVVKVKKVGQSEGISGDSKLMLQALVPEGSFEVEIKPVAPQDVAPTQEAAPAQVQEATTPVVEDEAPVGAPVVAPVDVPLATPVEAPEVAPVTPPVDAPVVEPVVAASTEPVKVEAAEVQSTKPIEEPLKATDETKAADELPLFPKAAELVKPASAAEDMVAVEAAVGEIDVEVAQGGKGCCF